MLAGIYGGLVLLFPEKAIASLFSDDAFYYFKIARKVNRLGLKH